METKHNPGLWQCLRQGTSVLGIAALSVLVTLAVQHLLTPPRAAAQSGAAQVVRASAFELVGPDGTILARLAVGGGSNGNLTLFDAAGKKRLSLGGAGSLGIYDPDGVTLRLKAGYNPGVGAQGEPPINGVELDANGTVGTLPASP